MLNKNNRKIAIIGVPLDYSSFGHKQGCDQAPKAIRKAGLKTGLERYNVNYVDWGDIAIPLAKEPINPRMKHEKEIAEVASELYKTTVNCLNKERLPLILGGDHSAPIGSIKAVYDFYQGNVGILWVDAHPDCNNEQTTTSGNIHGMALRQLIEGGSEPLQKIGSYKLKRKDVVLLGIKNPDPAELKFINQNQIKIVDIWQIEKKGIHQAAEKAVNFLLKDNKKIYISFDLDVIDQKYAKGLGITTYGGLEYRETLYLARYLRKLFQKGKMAGLDVAELNPKNDKNNGTAGLAVEIIMSILGYDYGPFVKFRDNRTPITTK